MGVSRSRVMFPAAGGSAAEEFRNGPEIEAVERRRAGDRLLGDEIHVNTIVQLLLPLARGHQLVVRLLPESVQPSHFVSQRLHLSTGCRVPKGGMEHPVIDPSCR